MARYSLSGENFNAPSTFVEVFDIPGVTSSSSIVYSFSGRVLKGVASIVPDAPEPVITSNLYRASGSQLKETKTLSLFSDL